MYHNPIDFIRFALHHAKPETIPHGATLPCSREDCGVDPWECLRGVHYSKVCTASESFLRSRYYSDYEPVGWSWEAFIDATREWIDKKGVVDSGIGLLNIYLDQLVTADYCYNYQCGINKSSLLDCEERPFTIGEAVFYRNSAGKMIHIGFVCGFQDGEPLIVEGRGTRFGVVVTKLSERPWTHRGLIDNYFDYTSSPNYTTQLPEIEACEFDLNILF